MYLRFVIGAGGSCSCSCSRSLLSIAQSPSNKPSNMQPEMNFKCCRRAITKLKPDEAGDAAKT